MITRLLIAFLVSIVPTVFAHAGNPTQAEFRKTARDIPEFLIASGYEKIGNFSLAKFIKELDSVHYEVTSEREYAQGRTYLKYDVEKKTVYFPATLDLSGAEGPLILLHESLGALGYIDDNYQISNSLYLLYDESNSHHLAKDSRIFALPEFQSSFIQTQRVSNPTSVQNSLNALARGGSNGVGGGGDPHAELTKFEAIYILLHVFREKGLVTDEEIVWINNHIGLETYSVLPGDTEAIGCPLAYGTDITAKFLLTIPSDGITKIYYPAACTEEFERENGLPTYSLPLVIIKKMVEIYSAKRQI